MLRSLARRERRPLWGALSIILLLGVGLTLFAATQSRNGATREATSQVRLIAQTELAPLLQPRDLMAPIVGERASELASAIDASITSDGPITQVRIYSSVGRVLYAEDTEIVGSRPSYIREITSDVVSGHARSTVRGGLLQTYVPIWLNPGGTIAVAELSQPYGTVAATRSGEWHRLALICAGLLLGSLVMVVMTTRAPARIPALVKASEHPAPRGVRRDKSERTPGPEKPLYQQEGFRAIEEQRRDAQRRAEAAEQNFRGVQAQLQAALAKVKDLEGRAAVSDTQGSMQGSELKSMQDELRKTSERLERAELDNAALRERMTLRQQELDGMRQQVETVRDAGPAAQQLQTRLEDAERRAAEMARQIELLEAELDSTKSSFHMTKLSEALREFDTAEDEVQSEEHDKQDEQDTQDKEGEKDEHDKSPVVLRNRRGHTTPEKVR
jgi:hypothetical protein